MNSFEEWRAPERRRRIPLAAAVAATAAAAALVVAYAWHETPAPPPALSSPPSPTQTAVTRDPSLDGKLISAALDKLAEVPALRSRGTVVVQSVSVRVDSVYLADGSKGSGVITIGEENAKTYRDEDKTYIQAGPAFWSALGVSTEYKGWTALPKELVPHELFIPVPDIVAALRPDDTARLQIPRYTVRGAVAILDQQSTVAQIELNGARLDLAPIDETEVHERPADTEKSESSWPPPALATITADTSSGTWSLDPPAPPPPTVYTPAYRPPPKPSRPVPRDDDEEEEDDEGDGN